MGLSLLGIGRLLISLKCSQMGSDSLSTIWALSMKKEESRAKIGSKGHKKLTSYLKLIIWILMYLQYKLK
jgi:hypothetical protein